MMKMKPDFLEIPKTFKNQSLNFFISHKEEKIFWKYIICFYIHFFYLAIQNSLHSILCQLVYITTLVRDIL